MPDWTYHPFFKPLLFRLPAEPARRLTLALLATQAKTRPGRMIFRLFGHGPPPESLAVDAFGLRFPCPVGVAQGIDTEAVAAPVLQYLGAGFIVVGPAGSRALPRRLATDPVRIDDRHAIALCPHASGLRARDLAAKVRAAPDLAVPVGIALRGRGQDLIEAAREAEEAASFFTLPPSCAGDERLLRALVASTRRPFVLRLPGDLEGRRLDEVVGSAASAGVRGVVALAGTPCPLLPDGEITGPFVHARSLAAIEQIARRHGDAIDVIGAGGVMSPGDALACLDAGAKLVELFEGLVFAGPGLPGRIIHALEDRARRGVPSIPRALPAGAPAPPPAEEERPVEIAAKSDGLSAAPEAAPPEENTTRGWSLLAFTGLVLIGAGIAALGIAATVKMLPYDVHFLGMTAAQLCEKNACRIVHFMAHDRVSFGGSIISIGILYVWLASGPLREGRAWAWWTLALSGVVGFASFLTYLGYGYLDLWHGVATMLLLPFYLLGIFWARATLPGPKGIGTLLRPGAEAWIYSPAGLGRLSLAFTALGMVLGGLTIMGVGVTRVFVPQDLAYMGITVEELNAVNPRLVPLIAHDRAGFGGGLFSGGLTVFFSLWCGAKPGAKGLWAALFCSGVVGFACAIGIHPIVGYTDFVHLAPAYAGAITFLTGLVLLYRPLWRGDPAETRFSDL
ncbi:MAG TPA: hypothetical protein VE093_36715 [Polyangiaceae bacterium]|nr:hypothetical protein [Polyangiaceae bacterium]